MIHRWDSIGQVMSGAWFPPDMTLRIEAKQFNLGFIRPENLVSHSLRVQAGFPVSVTEERLLSGFSAIKPRSVECCSDGCAIGSFFHLHTGSPELIQSDHRVLGHLSYQGPSPAIAQFGQAASSEYLLNALYNKGFILCQKICLCLLLAVHTVIVHFRMA